MADSTVRGRFLWHELRTTDTKSAGAFFAKVIGWKTQPWGDDGSYSLFASAGRQMAGLMTLPEEARKMGAPPHWLTYIGTPNVDETARLATSLGATILTAPEDIPTVGRYAVLQDPQGAVFSIFMPTGSQAAEAPPVVGDFSWHELATTDGPAAFAFYQRLFGWEETSAMDMGPDLGQYQMFGRTKTTPLGGIFNKPAQMPGPPSWLPYIRIAAAKKTADTVKKAGGKVINGPMEVPGGDWITQGLDLQGATFAVHSLNPATAAAPAPSAPAKKAATRKAVVKKAVAKKAAAKKKSAPAKKSAAKRPSPKKPAAKKAAPKKAAAKGKPAKKAMKKGKASKGKKASKRR
jgi:predicted enzyme related to lactoylglutathione lyase